MDLTLERISTSTAGECAALLDGIYERSPWVAERAASRRPFRSLAGLKLAHTEAVRATDRETQLALIHAHVDVIGKPAYASPRRSGDARTRRRPSVVDAFAIVDNVAGERMHWRSDRPVPHVAYRCRLRNTPAMFPRVALNRRRCNAPSLRTAMANGPRRRRGVCASSMHRRTTSRR